MRWKISSRCTAPKDVAVHREEIYQRIQRGEDGHPVEGGQPEVELPSGGEGKPA